jgi:hypothetical protein
MRLPWKIRDYERLIIEDIDGNERADCSFYHPETDGLKTTQFIVEAVNAHDSLKESYEIVKDSLSEMTQRWRSVQDSYAALQTANAELRATLRTAKSLMNVEGMDIGFINQALRAAEGGK